jgi:hypothetical protein
MGQCHFCSRHDDARPDQEATEKPISTTQDRPRVEHTAEFLEYHGLMLCFSCGISENIAKTLCLESGRQLPNVTTQNPYLDFWLHEPHVQQTIQWLRAGCHNFERNLVESYRFIDTHVPDDWDQNTFLFFRDSHAISAATLVHRVQITNRCDFLHAPVVAFHYLHCLQGRSRGGTLQLQDLILNTRVLDANTKARVLFHTQKQAANCMSSRDVFQRLIGPNCEYEQVTDFARVPDLVRKYGVGLVSGFEVTAAFCSGRQCVYTKEDIKQARESDAIVIGKQSMVIIGYRTLEDGTLRILMQNWWSNKQWMECDEFYFLHARAILFFAKLSTLTPHYNANRFDLDVYLEAYFGGDDTN